MSLRDRIELEAAYINEAREEDARVRTERAIIEAGAWLEQKLSMSVEWEGHVTREYIDGYNNWTHQPLYVFTVDDLRIGVSGGIDKGTYLSVPCSQPLCKNGGWASIIFTSTPVKDLSTAFARGAKCAKCAKFDWHPNRCAYCGK